MQEDFEARVKDMLEGLQGLWAQLEELHTGVTLTKEGGGGRGDLASAGTHAEVSSGEGLSAVLCCWYSSVFHLFGEIPLSKIHFGQFNFHLH